MERPDDGERHDDDELASALEEQVAAITSAIPIMAGPVVVRPDAAALTDDEVTALVGADLDSHDTLAAIDHLQTVLDARAATSAIPVVGGAAEGTAEPGETAEPDDTAEPGEEDDGAGAPTQLISFDDLPVPRDPAGPLPTFSAWVGAAAPARTVQEREPAPVTPSRAEPLGLVPEEFAPRDSEPVPLVVELPESSEPPGSAEPPEPPEPPIVPVLAIAEPVVSHHLGPADRTPDHIDTDVADDADDVVVSADSRPIATPRVPEGAAVVAGGPAGPRPFVPEPVDLEPTPLERRVGRASRLFWLWFAGTSSLISVGVGATLFELGLSLRQLLVATLVGVALSFLPLGLGTLAGKWSGQPTMVVSRAVFGLRGNVIPTVLALVTKLFWGAVLLWLAGSAAGSLSTAEGWSSGPAAPTMLALTVTILAAGAVAYFGYGLVARVQLVLTIASAVLIVVMVMATWRHVDLGLALAVPDALWTHVVTGAVLVFSYLGLAWAMSSSEVARYQRPTSSGATGMLWATFGAGVPPFVLVSYGGLLAASNPGASDDLAGDPVGALERLGLPAWYSVPLLLAVGLSLISALVLTIYSAGFTLDALGVRLGRRWSTLVVGGVVAVSGFVLAATVDELDSVIRGVPTALSVPVAAWAGLFAGETMLRTRRFHQPSLLRRGGVYPDWRWPNVVMLVVATVVGLGLVSSPLPWLAWEGYLFRLAGVDPHAGIGASNIGVALALVLGLVTPMLTGIREVRRQERLEA
ncbi:cytosine permease [Leifsonia sp. NPDC080035]|uniref:Cytosine permease n=1 Tax=Leifsonia sp. NPDC080035 TaxID=3143936 RepID=A0AAU7GB17_9MICO